jgi:uncharacterized metal-binding protein
MARSQLPLVYSCSGCSSAAQLANYLAVELDRSGSAEMSCIVGIGGAVAPIVRAAHSGRPLVGIDGCPLHCVAHVLEREGLTATLHVDLSTMGVKKRRHADFDKNDAERLLARLAEQLGDLR